MPDSIITCKKWRTQTFVGRLARTCCSVAQTHSFVSTGVLQTRVRLLTEGSRMLVVAVAAVCSVSGAALARAVARAEAEQRWGLAQLRFDRHVESQAQLAQLRRVIAMHTDEVVVTWGELRLIHRLTIRHVVREKESSGGGGAALEFLPGHVEQPDTVRPQGGVGRHQQWVTMLQLERADLWKVEKCRSLRLARSWQLEAPTICSIVANVPRQRPAHWDYVRLGAPLERRLLRANRLAADAVDDSAGNNQVERGRRHIFLPPSELAAVDHESRQRVIPRKDKSQLVAGDDATCDLEGQS